MTRIKRKKIGKNFDSKNKKVDYFFTTLVVMLTLFGLLMVFDASVVEAYQDFQDKFHFLKLQSIWAAVGLLGFIVSSNIPYSWYKKVALPIFIIVMILLIAVLIPGIGIKAQGARRWINLGFTVLQPSEITKMGVIIYLSSWLSRHQRFAPFIFTTSVVLGLIMLQPDLGTSIIIASISFVLYFVSGGSIKNIVISAAVGGGLALLLIVTSSYRMNRLKTFLDPTSDPLGTSYHIRQVLIALGSGGLTGQGIGKSRQKHQYLPEASTDSIFAIIGEETGFIGASLVMLAIFLLIYRGYKIAANTEDVFGRLLVSGVISWVGFQALVNLAAMVALVPLTGVPLPLISYGGSSLITTLFALGIVVNASKNQITTSVKKRR